uniref:Uncharacterized protein n=1 Tax=Panagrolaimus sp. JU765 TaxID=591449 RepID=A0AC34QC48_9BILA
MRLWIQRKKDYIRRHWRVAIAIGILIVVLIILFVTAALLLTLLPKKNSSIEANNFTPNFGNSTPTTAAPADSPHHFGFVESSNINSYQLPKNVTDINSIVIDRRRQHSLLIYYDNTVILLDTQNKTVSQKTTSLNQNCKDCRVFDVLDSCFNEKQCPSKDLIYCCNDCSIGGKTVFCSIYGIQVWHEGQTTLKRGEIYFNSNNGWLFHAFFINNVLENCNFELYTYHFAPNGTILGTVVGSTKPCSNNVSTTLLETNLISAQGSSDEDSLFCETYINYSGTLMFQLLTNLKQYFWVHNFIDIDYMNTTDLKMDYNIGDEAYLAIAFNGTNFSAARLTPQKVSAIDQLSVLQPLNYVFETSFGELIDWTVFAGQLHIWFLQDGRLNYVIFAFHW